MGADKKGIILLNLGGPDSLDAVKPFLFNLFSDREIISLGPSFLQKPLAWIIVASRVRKTQGNYMLIGGGSPLLKITEAQARALEAEMLGRLGVYVGMRYWSPFISDGVEKAVRDGVEELIALPLFPQYSRATTGSCFKELKKQVKLLGGEIDVTYIKSWHDNSLYIEALASSIKGEANRLPEKELEDLQVLFSAHALPQKFVDEGDPYVDQLKATINALSGIMELGEWKLSFQSKSGPVKWIGPSTEETLEMLGKEGIKNVLMVPISFVSDHIETLYELDILYKKKAEDLGINLSRAQSLNTMPKFIEALADIIYKNVEV